MVLAPTRATTRDAVADSTLDAATVPNSTRDAFVPPASRPMPSIVTRVPPWPNCGLTLSTTLYVQPFSLRTVTPLSPTMEMSPTALPRVSGPGLARTTTCVSVGVPTIVAGSPASDTDVADVPPPRMFVPLMVTTVPACPTAGDTSVMLPADSCSQAPEAVIIAPVSAIKTTSPTTLAPRSPATIRGKLQLLLCTCASNPASVAATMLLPPPHRFTPAMFTTVPACPDDGSTARISPWSTYVNASVLLTLAPLVDVMTMSPCVSASRPCCSTTTTSVSFSRTIVASTPTTVTFDTAAPPPRSDVPLIVTRVPSRPLSGTARSIVPTSTYVKPFASRTNAPVSDVTTTSPWPGTDAPASTTTFVLLSDTISAVAPASVTASTLGPLPRKLVPSIVTRVDAWPCAGVTLVITPAVAYVHPLTCVANAPESDVTTMSPDPAVAASATTFTMVSLPSTTVAAVPASVTLVISLPPPSSREPAICTRVPSCPIAGLAPATTLSSRYVHPSRATLRAPLDASTVTSVTPTVPFCASTTTCVELLDTMRAGGWSPRSTDAIDVPDTGLFPSSRLPAIVTTVPRWPDDGVTVSIWLAASYTHASPRLTRAPLLDVISIVLSPSVPLAPARTTTSVAVPLMTLKTGTPAMVTLLTELPPPSRFVPVMVSRVPSCPRGGSTRMMRASPRYVNTSALATTAPVLATMSTSTTPLVPAPSTATMLLLLADTTRCTATPPNVSDETLAPPPSRFVPLIVTTVPVTPDDGVTDVTLPSAMYSHVPAARTTAPVSISSTTSTAPPVAAPRAAVTWISVLFGVPSIEAASTAPSSTRSTVVPPDSSRSPRTSSLVPTCPDDGVTSVTFAGSRYSKLPPALTTAPLSAVSSTAPEPAPASFATTTTSVSLGVPVMFAATPFRVTTASPVEPPNRLVPRTVTRVPETPLSGVTDVMRPSSSCSQAFSPRTIAPLVDSISTSPTPAVPLDASTTTSVAFAVTTVAASPPSRTTDASLAPPSSRSPLMVTTVPRCPLLGASPLTTPAAVYVKSGPATARAPVLLSTTTRPAPAAPAPARATTYVLLLPASTSAATPASVTRAIELPPPNRPWPRTVTYVPSCPVVGAKLSTWLASTYVHSCVLVYVAPVSTVTVTVPFPGLPLPAAATIVVSLELTISSAATPASVTFTTLAPPASSPLPEIVTSVPSCPLGGLSADTAGTAAYWKPRRLVTRLPVLLSSVTSTRPAVPAGTVTTTADAVCDSAVAKLSPKRTVTPDPPPSSDWPVMVTRVPACPLLGCTL